MTDSALSVIGKSLKKIDTAIKRQAALDAKDANRIYDEIWTFLIEQYIDDVRSQRYSFNLDAYIYGYGYCGKKMIITPEALELLKSILISDGFTVLGKENDNYYEISNKRVQQCIEEARRRQRVKQKTRINKTKKG